MSDPIQEARNYLSQKRTELETAQSEYDNAINGLLTISWLHIKEGGDILSLAITLYWCHPEISPTDIAETLGVNRNKLLELVARARFKSVCPSCQKQTLIQYTSRTNQKQNPEKLCSDCEQAEKERKEIESLERKMQLEQWKKQRNEQFQQLVSLPYSEYLKSDHWQQTRKYALKRAGFACQLCNVKGVSLHVHHRTYKNLGHEDNRDLIVLCADCHAKFHDKLEQKS